VKSFPAGLEGLALLPSRDSDSFYLLNSGQLMLAQNLACHSGNWRVESFSLSIVTLTASTCSTLVS